jgi:ABC-type amino acid transport substrate-binding protein
LRPPAARPPRQGAGYDANGTGLLVMKSTPGYSSLTLADAIKAMSITATVVPLQTREEGLAQLESGAIDAVASDRVLLLGLAAKAKDVAQTALLAEALSYEPYAIALPRGDWALQQAVDAPLAQAYANSEQLQAIYMRWFAGLGDPSPALQIVYGLGRHPP